MEKSFYTIAAIGFVVFAVLGMIIDNYRDKRRKVITYDSHGNEICSHYTSGLMVFYVIAFIVVVCIVDIVKS